MSRRRQRLFRIHGGSYLFIKERNIHSSPEIDAFMKIHLLETICLGVFQVAKERELLQVTSIKDQAQYWADSSNQYVFLPASKMAEAFRNSKYGSLFCQKKYWMFCKSPECIRFPVLHLILDSTCTLVIEAVVWPTLYTTLLVLHLVLGVLQMALGLFRMMASLARDLIITNTFVSAALLVIFLLGGFFSSFHQICNVQVTSVDGGHLISAMIKPWWIWGVWLSPLSYWGSMRFPLMNLF